MNDTEILEWLSKQTFSWTGSQLIVSGVNEGKGLREAALDAIRFQDRVLRLAELR